MDKLKQFTQSKIFKYSSRVFWIVYLGAIIVVSDTFIHLAMCWNCPSLSYRVFYKIGLILKMDNYEISKYFDLLLLYPAGYVFFIGFFIMLFGVMFNKFILRNKTSLYWISILMIALILFLIGYFKSLF